MGVVFEFDAKSQLYKLVNRDYDPIDLICIADFWFRYLDPINMRGYVSDYYLQNTFFVHISKHYFH